MPQFIINWIMKRIPKIITPPPPSPLNPSTPPSPLSYILHYLTVGLGVGMLFEGSFLLLGFENRAIKSVTANQLEEIRKMDQDVRESVLKGSIPSIPLNLLTDKQRVRVEKLNEQQSAKK